MIARINRRLDLVILAATFLLSVAGLAAVYSATRGGPFFFKQLLWVGIGWAAFALALAVPYRLVLHYAWIWYFATLAALLVLAARAVAYGGAAHRWLTLGPLTLQPSEAAKVATVLLLALVLDVLRRWGGVASYAVPVAVAALPALLVAVEPDLGTAVLFVPLLFACLYWAEAPLSHVFLLFSPLLAVALSFKLPAFLAVVAAVVAVALLSRLSWWVRGAAVAANVVAGLATPLLWGLLKEYQKARILSFLAPTADPRGAGYSSIQAKIAFGSGRLFGKGFLGGSQVHLKFLPAGHTDFIFASWGEEWGFAGAAAVVALFAVLVIRTFLIAHRAADRRGAVMAFGLGALFLTQFAANVAMAAGLIPVVGIPLPFMSYGGSATVMSFVAVGLILNVKLRRERVADQLKMSGYY